jgi:cystathionine beta-lyase
LEQNSPQNRRSFLRNSGLSTSVLALGPLLANVATEAAAAASPGGKFDFDTPLNRLGTDSGHWDLPKREEHMSRIVAGMGIADMDFRCAPAVMAAIARRMQHDNWGYIDLGSPGPEAFTQSIIDWNKRRHGINVMRPDNMAISTGVHTSLAAALRAVAPPGSKVLMTTPMYSDFYADLVFTKTVPNESLMTYVNGKYEIDWDDLERRMTPDTKAMILCNPQNPTGNVWTKNELARIGELCLKHKIVVLSDEIHADFVANGHKFTPFSTLDSKDVVHNSITLSSANKSFSLPGLPIAWFFSTNPDLFQRVAANDRPDLNVLAMIAHQAVYTGGEGWLNQCVDYIDGNQDFANQYIKANIPMLKVGQKPEGTYLIWADATAVAEKIDAQKLADLENKKPQPISEWTGKRTVVTSSDIVGHWFARNAYVKINSGSDYGKGGANHMRVNIATARPTLKAALDSMANALKNLA